MGGSKIGAEVSEKVNSPEFKASWSNALKEAKADNAADGGSKSSLLSKLTGFGAVAGGVAQAGGSKVAAVGQAAGGAAFAAGAGGVVRVYDAIDDPGFWLFLGGIFTFWLGSSDGLSNVIALLFATIFLFYTTIFIFKGRGLVVVLAFFIMYVYFGGRIAFDSIYTVVLPAFFIAMVIRGLMSKLTPGGESFWEGISSEWLGLIPVLFFLIDIGIVEFTAQYFSFELPLLVQNMLLFFPIWAYVGLFSTKKSNAVINLVKVVSIIYLFIIVFMLTPLAVYGESFVAGPESLFSAKADMRQGNGGVAESQFKSMGYCIKEGKLVDGLNECMILRQRESVWEDQCRQQQPDDVKRCVDEQRKRFEQGGEAQGTVDTELSLFTTGTITIDDKTFPKQVRALVGDSSTQRQYVAYLKLSNPFGQTLSVRGSCDFKQSRTVEEGEFLIAGNSNVEMISGKEIEVPLACTPSEPLNGAYTLSFHVIIENLHTTSYLKRAFIRGDSTAEQVAQVRSKILSTEFSSSADYVSKAPKEFARLNFGMGSTEKDPVIVAGDPIIFVSSIESANGVGVKGKLEKVRSYSFNLVDKGFGVTSSGSDACLEGGDVLVWPGQSQPLTSCFISVPTDFTDFSAPYVVETFMGELVYDYNLTKEIPIRVDVMDPVTMKPVKAGSVG